MKTRSSFWNHSLGSVINSCRGCAKELERIGIRSAPATTGWLDPKVHIRSGSLSLLFRNGNWIKPVPLSSMMAFLKIFLKYLFCKESLLWLWRHLSARDEKYQAGYIDAHLYKWRQIAITWWQLFSLQTLRRQQQYQDEGPPSVPRERAHPHESPAYHLRGWSSGQVQYRLPYFSQPIRSHYGQPIQSVRRELRPGFFDHSIRLVQHHYLD